MAFTVRVADIGSCKRESEYYVAVKITMAWKWKREHLDIDWYDIPAEKVEEFAENLTRDLKAAGYDVDIDEYADTWSDDECMEITVDNNTEVFTRRRPITMKVLREIEDYYNSHMKSIVDKCCKSV